MEGGVAEDLENGQRQRQMTDTGRSPSFQDSVGTSIMHPHLFVPYCLVVLLMCVYSLSL